MCELLKSFVNYEGGLADELRTEEVTWELMSAESKISHILIKPVFSRQSPIRNCSVVTSHDLHQHNSNRADLLLSLFSPLLLPLSGMTFEPLIEPTCWDVFKMLRGDVHFKLHRYWGKHRTNVWTVCLFLTVTSSLGYLYSNKQHQDQTLLLQNKQPLLISTKFVQRMSDTSGCYSINELNQWWKT